MAYNWDKTIEYPITDWFLAMLNGARMDMAMAGYITLLPGLIIALTVGIKGSFIRPVINFYTLLWMLISAFLVAVDMELYRHWGFRLDATPLNYIGGDNNLTNVAPIGTTLKLIPILLLTVWVGFRFYLRVVAKQFNLLSPINWVKGLAFIILTALLIVPIRSSFDVAPMNIGFVYFHKQPYPNHSAINVVWNAFYSLTKFNKTRYPNNYFDKENTEQIFTDLYKDNGTTTKLLKTDRPNIILIVWESLNAQIVEELGPEKGVTPQLSKLIKEGVLFSNFYATGDRTDKGIPGVLSSYPSQPKTAIIKFNNKLETMDFLSMDLRKHGYDTEFIFGNDVNFANFNSYFNIAGFEKVIHKLDFPQELWTTKWGVHDEHVFKRILDELNTKPQDKPFFLTTLTISSHEPFDVPLEPKAFPGEDKTNMFLNSYYYTDKCVGEFISEAKKQPWWDNTLVIITGDHGALYKDDIQYYSRERYQIPMVWTGGALAVQDTVVSKYGSQTDIATTVLHQLDINKRYKFGKNLLSSESNNFAFYTLNDGYGFVSDSLELIYDNVGKQYIVNKGTENSDTLNIPKAYMQSIYTDFNNRGNEVLIKK
ncbi:sulfatase-like hydrolase/transferase [Limibacter armeniacum]|uniref:LTA synthase family protein n=1 Tax=Limibacter armeniacum TaxID=466084 RepID=UPI002FE58CE9